MSGGCTPDVLLILPATVVLTVLLPRRERGVGLRRQRRGLRQRRERRGRQRRLRRKRRRGSKGGVEAGLVGVELRQAARLAEYVEARLAAAGIADRRSSSRRVADRAVDAPASARPAPAPLPPRSRAEREPGQIVDDVAAVIWWERRVHGNRHQHWDIDIELQSFYSSCPRPVEDQEINYADNDDQINAIDLEMEMKKQKEKRVVACAGCGAFFLERSVLI